MLSSAALSDLLANAETLRAGASCTCEHEGLRFTIRRFLTHWWAVSGVRLDDGYTCAQLSGHDPKSLLLAVRAHPGATRRVHA